MIFSSPIFLFAFLPLVLIAYYSVPNQAKNIVLLAVSLFFYAWGEVFYVAIMLFSIGLNYKAGVLIQKSHDENPLSAKTILIVGVTLNLLLLVSFKYSNFIADNINLLLGVINISPISLEPVHLPLGISFFTFQALSYLVDVYRKEVPAQSKLLDLGLYISLFPQLIAGPIVRYIDVATQITERRHSSELFASGIRRFVIGLGKKMLIANPLGAIADNAFLISGDASTMQIAWIGIIAYALQIYFDFSGYSDMAIGLGRMFGFKFLENFNYPYISTSMREFWRRWHISLSSWFRDYVYIPLGGNRVSTARVYFNLLIVFLLTGIWHGASWNFVVWGLFHGFFLTCEHAGFKHILSRIWAPIRHLYVLMIVLISWVFFRANDLNSALIYLANMFDFSSWQTSAYHYSQVFSNESVYVLVLGTILSIPIIPRLKQRISSDMTIKIGYAFANISTFCLMYLCAIKMSASTYNPFIYFRF